MCIRDSGYRREESVEIEPVVKRVLEAAREGRIVKADAALLKKEFARMAASGNQRIRTVVDGRNQGYACLLYTSRCV